MRAGSWLVPLGTALLAGGFAYLNAGERVVLNLGVARFYGVSLAALLFASFIFGMMTMFLLGLRHDLRVRRALRERAGAAGDRPPPTTGPPPAM